MKVLVLGLALLLHQVMCDGNTQLITGASNDFANRLYQKVSQPVGNVLVCPLSLHVALALVHQGAGGNTAQQLAATLGLGRANSNSVRESYRAVLTTVKDNTLKIATKLFPSQDYQLNPDYVNIAQNYFLSDVTKLDYNNAQAAATKINSYVEEKTNNKIHNLISPDAITSLTRLIIINAVHFQASWKKTFATAYLDDFKVSKNEKIKTRMMSQTDTFEYKEDPVLQAKVLKMDYSEGGYSMLFILPNKEDGLQTLEAKLATTTLENILKDLKETRVEVTIPKFKLEQTLNLKQTLIEMGMQDIFSPRADLRKVASGGENLYVTDVIQKTFINVHENGTEAAAATVLLETLSANFDEKRFFAKRPFHFSLIRSQVPKMVLFEGRYERPEYAETDSEETDSPDANANTIGNNKEETENPHRINFEDSQIGNQNSQFTGQPHQTGVPRPNGGLPTHNSPNNNQNHLNSGPVSFPSTESSLNGNSFEEPQKGNQHSQNTGQSHQTGFQRPNSVLPTQNSPNGNPNQFDSDRSSFPTPTPNTFNNPQQRYPNQPSLQPYGTQPPYPNQPQAYWPTRQMTQEEFDAYVQQSILAQQQQSVQQRELRTYG